MKHVFCQHRLLFSLLAVSFLSYCSAITWGLPAPITWAPDELVPHLVKAALQANFSGGWHTQYPPLHFFLITLLHYPFVVLGSDNNLTLTLVGRSLSICMAVGSLAALYLIGRRFLAPVWAVVGVALFAFTPQMVYYGKIANLDVPYLFWLLWSFVVLWRVLDKHRFGDYLLFVLLATAAVCTKEQAYGFYVLLVPLLFISRVRSPLVLHPFAGKDVVLSFIFALICFVLFQNILFHPEGFLAHFELITGSKFRGYRMMQPDLKGHWDFLLLSIELVAFVMSIPVFILGMIGSSVAVVKQTRQRWLLLAVLSYQVFLLHVILYSYDRFFLPIAAFLSLFAALGLMVMSNKLPRLGLVLAVLLVGFQFARGLELNLLMMNDTRYRAERWMDSHLSRDRVIGLFGQRRYLPRYYRYPIRKTVDASVDKFGKIFPHPECVVMLHQHLQSLPRSDPARRFRRLANTGRFGLQVVYSEKETDLGRVFFNPRRFLGRPMYRTSNLAKISPPVKIYSVNEHCL